MKKLLWTGLAAITTAVASAVALRMLASAWTRVTHEPPPEMPKWAKLAVAPLRKKVASTTSHAISPEGSP